MIMHEWRSHGAALTGACGGRSATSLQEKRILQETNNSFLDVLQPRHFVIKQQLQSPSQAESCVAAESH